MHNRIPERTATAAQLADETARIERARTGRQPPRTLHALTEQGALLVPCGQCWQRPGRPCNRYYPPGNHLARFQRAERRGLISRDELARVIAGLDVIAQHILVPDGEVSS